MNHSHLKRLLALVLAAVMVMGVGVPGVQATGTDEMPVDFEKLDPSSISTQLINSSAQVEQNSTKVYADTDMVRVTITLEGEPAIAQVKGGASTIGLDPVVTNRRQELERQQASVAAAISSKVLGGKELDVVWNLTLVSNAMSANVQYGMIDKIAAMDGVVSVEVETRYMPLSADTNNIVSQEMTGANAIQNVGYTGAGTKIAIIDTGTDTDHQSFSEAGYLYALAQNAQEAGMTVEEYAASLDLLTVEKIAAVLNQLNAAERYQGLTAEDLYLTAKLPFGFNYVDRNLNVTHDMDDMGSHGSHVAGIAAANDYITAEKLHDFNASGAVDQDDAAALLEHMLLGTAVNNIACADLSGDGVVSDYDAYLLLNSLGQDTYVAADETVGVSGTAPDAQIITMKVFGADGGAYTSDYMAAVEDAVTLGCDVVNLSLGSPYEGFTSSYDETYDAIMEALALTNTVMTVSAGNSGAWADTDDAYHLMYADEAGIATTTEPATLTNALSIASANNTAFISDLTSVFEGANGEKMECSFFHPTDVVLQPWKSLAVQLQGSTYDVVFLGDPTELLTGGEQTDSRIYAGMPEDFAGYDFTGKVVLVSRGTYNFGDKHANAALAGAAAVIIYNNIPGALGVLLEGTNSDIPCVSISMEEAQVLYSIFEKNADGLYAGKLTVKSGVTVQQGSGTIAMSAFSSWGTTGALTIKPEITAPGGGIYSVNGVDPSGTAYETMSGTSMSSPHVAGLAALAAQYIRENGLAEKTGLSVRVLTQSLLMSTAQVLTEEASGVEYSVRSQGAGLANIEHVVNADSYILVDGQPDGKVKAELGDGVEGWSFSFTIHNLSGEEMTYALDSSILTTGTIESDGHALTTNQMVELDANVTYSTGETVTVPANGSASVTVTVQVSQEAAAEMEALGNTNGFFVEGYVYATPVESDGAVAGVIHSIPLLGWYGNWTDPSMYDTGSLYEYIYGAQERPSHIHSFAKNFAAMTLAGTEDAFYYTGNIYGGYNQETGEVIGDQRYFEERNAVNTTEDRVIEFFGLFPTLVRNATDLKIEVRNAETGEVYFVNEYEDYILYGSFYYAAYGYIYDVTLDTGITLMGWDYTDANGNPIPEDTKLTFALLTAPEYYTQQYGSGNWDNIGTGAELSYTFTVDNTAPQLADMADALVVRDNKLYYTAQDNNYVASVILMNGTATEILSYSYPDMDVEQKGLDTTGALDLSGYTEKYGNKAVIAVCDYAGNEAYYSVNLNGQGEDYDDLVAFQYDESGIFNAWVSFGEGVARNETGMFATDMAFVNAEYVNGFVYAQTEDGKLYGIPYEEMLNSSLNLETTFVAQLENVYQDLAYSYEEGKLYGLFVYEDDGYPTTEIHSINLKGEYYDENMWTTVAPFQEDWVLGRGGLYGLALACDDAGSLYVLGPNYDFDTESMTETAHLWTVGMEYDQWSDSWMLGWGLSEIGDVGLSMDYLQSMTWDHNTEQLYWARFAAEGMNLISELILLDPANVTTDDEGNTTVGWTKVGDLSSETCGLFAPLSAESAAKEEHANVPEMDSSVVGTPILRKSTMTMNLYGVEQLVFDFDPWYTAHTHVIWTSDNEEVITVDGNGFVTAVGQGSATVTVANAADESLFDTCTIEVTALDLRLEGIISAMGQGIGNVSGASIYEFTMDKGNAAIQGKAPITATEDLNYGLSLATSELGRGSIWACEYGNTGMIYEIDPETGAVKDVYEPIDGDMMFGMTYSEQEDSFAAIMDMYLYTDIPMTHEMTEDMLNSYDEELHAYTWHRVDLLPCLQAANGGFITGETGQGASSEVVFCGITSIDGGIKDSWGETYHYDNYRDFLGGWGSMECSYQPDQTLILLDNVGRLWYINEVKGVTAESDEWGNVFMTTPDGGSIDATRNGVVYYEVIAEDGTSTYNVYHITKIQETPLTDMFREGTMPRITYHFSDIEFAGYTAEGDPMIAMSLYDYWNNGITNELYLYVPGHDTGEMDYETWKPIYTPDRLFSLGNTGEYNIIASIHSAEVTGGVDPMNTEEPASVNSLYAGLYTK